jgi:serine/threonine protein kinase
VNFTVCNHAEVLNPQGRTISGFCSDVYSFGIVIWEIVSGQWPFHNQTTMQILTAVGINKENPPIPENTNYAIRIMMQRCWHINPESRATMADLESYVMNTKEFDPDIRMSMPTSIKNTPSAELDHDNVPGAIQVQDSYQESHNDTSCGDDGAKPEPQTHVLADIPELGESWPL